MGRAVLIVFGIFVLLIVMGQINKALRPTPTLIHNPAEARATIAAPTATSTPLSSPHDCTGAHHHRQADSYRRCLSNPHVAA